MGLDMYLSVREYVSRIDYSKGWENREETLAFRTVTDALGAGDLAEPEGHVGMYVEIPVLQWRKANAIHNWFIRELADGVDDCRPLEMTVDRARELVNLCDKVTDDNSRASELLPTGEGFFFGGTDYDEYYYEDVRRTADRMRYILAEMEAKNMDWLVYQASW